MEAPDVIDELAASLGVSPEARKKWRQRGAVPHKWRLPILDLAAKRGVKIPLGAFDAASEKAA